MKKCSKLLSFPGLHQCLFLFTMISYLVISSSSLMAQSYRLPLWPQGQVPNYRDVGETEISDTTNIVRIRNVQEPDIAVYLPSKTAATGEAVVICPGGGYRILAYDWEGSDVAKWFNSKGIAAIVVKYRLPSSPTNIVPHLTPLMDLQRAMRLVRYNARKWNIDPSRVGVMGFSAGGHLASTLTVHFDYGDPNHADPVEQMSCRPDFSMLIYPVISSDHSFWHQGSFRALLGENPTQELLNHYSAEKNIKADTPPAILIHSGDDRSVPVRNSIVYYEALLENEIPAEMHLYPYGGHGYSLAIGKGYLSTWPDRVYDWLKHLMEQKD